VCKEGFGLPWRWKQNLPPRPSKLLVSAILSDIMCQLLLQAGNIKVWHLSEQFTGYTKFRGRVQRADNYRTHVNLLHAVICNTCHQVTCSGGKTFRVFSCVGAFCLASLPFSAVCPCACNSYGASFTVAVDSPRLYHSVETAAPFPLFHTQII